MRECSVLVWHTAQKVLYGCDAVHTVVLRHADSTANACYLGLGFPATQCYPLVEHNQNCLAQPSTESHRAVREPPLAPLDPW